MPTTKTTLHLANDLRRNDLRYSTRLDDLISPMRTRLHLAHRTPEHATLTGERLPFDQCGQAAFPVSLSIDEMAFLAEMVVERSMDGGEFLQGLHLPEPQHRPFSSSER
jgi:hypothetical protein